VLTVTVMSARPQWGTAGERLALDVGVADGVVAGVDVATGFTVCAARRDDPPEHDTAMTTTSSTSAASRAPRRTQ
jgi:hypothetical protein